MYDFNECLQEKEAILWSGKPNTDKGSKNVGGEIFLILFTIIVQAVMVWSMSNKVGDGTDGVTPGFVFLFAVLAFFGIIGIYGIISKLFLNKILVKNDEYCITDKRIIIYKGRKKELHYGYLINYHNIGTDGVKGKFGNLICGIENLDESAGLKKFGKFLFWPDKNNMPYINLFFVENVGKVKQMAVEQRKKLIKENAMPTIDNIRI